VQLQPVCFPENGFFSERPDRFSRFATGVLENPESGPDPEDRFEDSWIRNYSKGVDHEPRTEPVSNDLCIDEAGGTFRPAWTIIHAVSYLKV